MFNYFLENNHYLSLFSILLILGLAFVFSTNYSKISLRLIGINLGMQFITAAFILKTSVGEYIFKSIANGFSALYKFADKGGEFIFGNLTNADGPWGFIFVAKVAPVVIFFASLITILFHLKIIQFCVKLISTVLCPLLGTSGAETLCVVANSMLGQMDSTLLIKSYLERMTISEMLVVVIAGMATLSGPLIAIYGSMGVPMVHLLCSSMMSIFSIILISKILIPETEKPTTTTGSPIEMKSETSSVIDAISQGAIQGLKLAGIIIAMLITFISVIALVNSLLKTLGYYTLTQFGINFKLSLKNIFGTLFGPIAYLLGISHEDVSMAGNLIGKKVVLNEFIAYSQMIKAQLSERSLIILTYALAGCANFSAIGLAIGGVTVLAPSKRELLSKLGMRALLGATLVNLLNAAVAALLI